MNTNGDIGTGTAATLALLADTSRAGNRGSIFGSGEGSGASYLAQSAIADGTALKTGQDCHAASMAAGLDRTSAQNKETREILADQFENQTRQGQVDDVKKGQTDAEFRSIARDNATNARVEANNIASIERDHRAEIKAIECCCKAEATAREIESNRLRDDLAVCRQSKLDDKLDMLLARTGSWDCGCPDQTGDTVILCFEDETIEVPQAEVKDYLALGAVCGGCDERCCPDTPTVDGKIDMCLNDNTINVNRNACKGIKQAGGICGACPTVEETPEPE